MVGYYILLAVAAAVILPSSEAFYITVDAHAEECFFDKVKAGSKLGLMFQVAEGGFLDIDVRIEGPDGKNLYEGERESNGKYTFAAHMDGVYRYCFSNKMSTMTPKIVMFTMEILDAAQEKEAGADGDDESSHNKLENMIKELGTALTSVKHEQDYMNVRDKIHRTINESTNSRVVLWSFFEALVLVSMTIGQVYYLKRFFEVRRVV